MLSEGYVTSRHHEESSTSTLKIVEIIDEETGKHGEVIKETVTSKETNVEISEDGQITESHVDTVTESTNQMIDEDETNQAQTEQEQEQNEDAIKGLEEMKNVMQQYEERLAHLQELRDMKWKQEQYAQDQLKALESRQNELQQLMNMISMVKELKDRSASAAAANNLEAEEEDGEDNEQPDEQTQPVDDEVEVEAPYVVEYPKVVRGLDEIDENIEKSAQRQKSMREALKSGKKRSADTLAPTSSVRFVDVQEDIEEVVDEEEPQVDQEANIYYKTRSDLQGKLRELSQVQAEINYLSATLANLPVPRSEPKQVQQRSSKSMEEARRTQVKASFEKVLKDVKPESLEYLKAIVNLLGRVNKNSEWLNCFAGIRRVISIVEDQKAQEEEEEDDEEDEDYEEGDDDEEEEEEDDEEEEEEKDQKNDEKNLLEGTVYDEVISYLASFFCLIQEKGIKALGESTKQLMKQTFLDVWSQFADEQRDSSEGLVLSAKEQEQLNFIFNSYVGKDVDSIKEDMIVSLVEFIQIHNSKRAAQSVEAN